MTITGKFEGYVWEKAKYWYDNQDAFKKEWERIAEGRVSAHLTLGGS